LSRNYQRETGVGGKMRLWVWGQDMGFIEGDARTQGTLFPVRLEKFISDDHFCRVIGLRSSCGMSIVQVEKSKMNSGFIGRLNPKPELLDQAAHFDVLPEQVGLH